MAELADAQDLGSCEEIRVGSTPTTRTNLSRLLLSLLFIGDDLYAISLSAHSAPFSRNQFGQ